MVTLTITGAKEGAARFAALAPRLHAALRETVEREAIALQAHVVGGKLSGQVLNVRSGTLRRSITYTVDDTPAGITATVGTNVRYARIHEYGGTVQIPELVPRHAEALHFMVGGASVFAMRTRAHPVTLPERSFLRSALADRKAAIVAAVRAAIAGVLGAR